VLDEIGITAYVIAVAVRIEDGCQAKTSFLQNLQEPSARTLPNARINQERSLACADN